MSRGRWFFLLALWIAWLIIILVRLYDLQVRRHAEFLEVTELRSHEKIELVSRRGTIFDARGRVLASSAQARSVGIFPSQVFQPLLAAESLSEVLETDPDELAERLVSDEPFFWILRQRAPEETRAVEDLGLAGVLAAEESTRSYPLEPLAAPVLGLVGPDQQGLAGLEAEYESLLRGEPRPVAISELKPWGVEHDAREATIEEPGELFSTLDSTLQQLASTFLTRAVESSEAAEGTLIALEANSGAVLALVSVSAAVAASAAGPDLWQTPGITQAFEPGMVIAPLALGAAVESGAFEDSSDQEGCPKGLSLEGEDSEASILVGGRRIGAAELGLGVGNQELFDTLGSFGLGRPTGIDLPGESAGVVRPLERWSNRTAAMVAQGRSIAVTAIQLAVAYAAIANGGFLPRPHLVHAIRPRGGEGEIETLAVEPGPSVGWSAATLETVGSLLEEGGAEGGSRGVADSGYRVAGMAGQAAKTQPGASAAESWVRTFAGYAPAHNPAIVSLVVLDGARRSEPQPAEVFHDFMEQALLYLGASPADAGTGDLTVRGSATWDPFFVDPSRRLGARDAMPDFAGLSARQALALAGEVGLRVVLQGRGIVQRQEPEAETQLPEPPGTVELWLESGVYR